MSKEKEEQIQEIVGWCEEMKRARGRVPLIERNIFCPKYVWTCSKVRIEIDMPLEIASKEGFVYDSVLKCLWEWRNGVWARVTKD